MDETTPRFTHSCPNCTFLGRFNEFDLYYCPQGRLPTVLARYGNYGPEYQSGMESTELPALAEARRRALEKGLLKKTTLMQDLENLHQMVKRNEIGYQAILENIEAVMRAAREDANQTFRDFEEANRISEEYRSALYDIAMAVIKNPVDSQKREKEITADELKSLVAHVVRTFQEHSLCAEAKKTLERKLQETERAGEDIRKKNGQLIEENGILKGDVRTLNKALDQVSPPNKEPVHYVEKLGGKSMCGITEGIRTQEIDDVTCNICRVRWREKFPEDAPAKWEREAHEAKQVRAKKPTEWASFLDRSKAVGEFAQRIGIPVIGAMQTSGESDISKAYEVLRKHAKEFNFAILVLP
jgi:hypothetical protein